MDSTTSEPCPACNCADLKPEHQHQRCPDCGYIIGCCEGEPQ